MTFPEDRNICAFMGASSGQLGMCKAQDLPLVPGAAKGFPDVKLAVCNNVKKNDTEPVLCMG